MRGFPTFWICITALHQLLTQKQDTKQVPLLVVLWCWRKQVQFLSTQTTTAVWNAHTVMGKVGQEVNTGTPRQNMWTADETQLIAQMQWVEPNVSSPRMIAQNNSIFGYEILRGDQTSFIDSKTYPPFPGRISVQGSCRTQWDLRLKETLPELMKAACCHLWALKSSHPPQEAHLMTAQQQAQRWGQGSCVSPRAPNTHRLVL